MDIFEDEFKKAKVCELINFSEDYQKLNPKLIICQCNPNEAYLICEDCIECHDCQNFFDLNPDHNEILTECDCKLANHNLKFDNFEKAKIECYHNEMLKLSPYKYTYSYIRNGEKIKLCEYCSNKCITNENITKEIDEDQNHECHCSEGHDFDLDKFEDISNIFKNLINADFNIFTKFKEPGFIQIFEKLNLRKIDLRMSLNLDSFIDFYHITSLKKFFIPINYFKNFSSPKEFLTILFDKKENISMIDRVKLFFIMFLTEIKSVFHRELFIIKMESVVNMDSDGRKYYLEEIKKKKCKLDIFNGIDHYIKLILDEIDVSKCISKNLHCNNLFILMMKFFIKYNLIDVSTSKNYYFILEKLLMNENENERKEHIEVEDYNRVLNENNNLVLCKTVLYTILRYNDVYDPFIKIDDLEKENLTLAIRCFIYAIKNIKDSIKSRTMNPYISIVLDFISCGYSGGNPFLFSLDFVQDKLEPFTLLINKIGSENRKFLILELKYDDYLKNIRELFKQVIYGKFQCDIQIICQNENFYSKYFEFIEIYKRINQYFGDYPNYNKIEDEILIGLLSFIQKSFNKNVSNLKLFLSVDTSTLIDIHYHLEEKFLKFLDELFLENYLPELPRFTSITFIIEFWDHLKNKIQSNPNKV